MPPPFNFKEPKQPKQSSGGILGTLKSLAGSHKEREEPSSTASTPTGARNGTGDYLNPGSPPGKNPLRRGITEPANVAEQGSHTSNHHEQEPLPFAASAESKDFIKGLSDENSTKGRIKAAQALAPLLRDYLFDNVGTVWASAADLLDAQQDPETFAAALRLFKLCIQNAGSEPADKRRYFESMTKYLVADIAECVECLRLITDQAREFAGLDMTRVVALLSRLLTAAYSSITAAKRKIKLEKSGSSSLEHAHLEAVVDFLQDSFKFSAKMYTESHMEDLLDIVLDMCLKTSNEQIISDSLRLLETVMTYSSIPVASLRNVMEVLCAIRASPYSALQASGANITWMLLGSHHADIAIEKLYGILGGHNGEDRTDKLASPVLRGAVLIFGELLITDKARIPVVHLQKLLQALQQASRLQSPSLELDILGLLTLVVDQSDAAADVFAEDTWSLFQNVLHNCTTGSLATSTNRMTSASEISLGESIKDNQPSGNVPAVHVRKAFSELSKSLYKRAVLGKDIELVSAAADRAHTIMLSLLSISKYLEEKLVRNVIDYCRTSQLHIAPEDDWLKACQLLMNNVMAVSYQPQDLRLLAVKMVSEAYTNALAYGMRESESLLDVLASSITITMDSAVLQSIIKIVIDVAVWTDDADLFDTIVDRLQDVLSPSQPHPAKSPIIPPLQSLDLANIKLDDSNFETGQVRIAKGLVVLFLRTVHRSFAKAERLYHALLAIARSANTPANARIVALKALVRLRGDINHGIFVVADTESQNLAAALCRTVDSAVLAHIRSSPTIRPTRPEEASRQKPASGSPDTSVSRSNSSAGRHSTISSRINQPTPPLWMYPGPKGLPEEPYKSASHVVYSHLDDDKSSSEDTMATRRGVLDIGEWLTIVLEMINSSTIDWEIFSYIIVHLGAQVSNHSLFVGAIPQVKELRRTLCDKLAQRNYIDPPAFSNLKKSDAAVCLYQILIMLISYGHHFHKDDEQDPIVKALVFGIGSWDTTSEMCIHGLSICCHEMPSLLIRYLDNALQRMTQIIARSTISASILEFLATLARLPELFRNFGEDNFKNVFGICFRYLQSARDHRSRPVEQSASRAGRSRDSSSKPARDTHTASTGMSTRSPLGEALPQYVYALTFHAMTFWFMALKLPDRKKHIVWIIQNLVYRDESGKDVLEEHAEVTIDMMYRVAFSDRDETLANPNFAKATDGMVSSKDYLVGDRLLTVETAGRSGATQITTRRPSGTIYSSYRPMIVDLPRHQTPITIGLAADTFQDSDYIGVTPDHIMQSLYAMLSPGASLASLAEVPMALPDDDATRRAIGTFDRIPALDGHKVGIIYIAEAQTSESAILANVMGSADYMSFLNGIGTLMELKGAGFNTQGLDREFDTDGKFTYCWRDRVTELVFHVTTMMPTDLEHDPQCALKKRHVGNDFVKIMFNNSGLPFDFNTFPSDFNYINIVITPEARASFIETRLHAKAGKADETFYKVAVITRQDLPKISPASETKIISATSLPAFVRLLALNASVFSLVWSNRANGEYVSSWRSRLREIRRLRQRHAAPVEHTMVTSDAPGAVNSPPTTSASNDVENGGMARASSMLRRASGLFSDASASSGANNRSSLLSGTGGDVERSRASSSAGSHGA